MAKQTPKGGSLMLPAPKAKSPKTRALGVVTPTRITPMRTRIYTKGITADPSEFGSSGFGSTGMSGRS